MSLVGTLLWIPITLVIKYALDSGSPGPLALPAPSASFWAALPSTWLPWTGIFSPVEHLHYLYLVPVSSLRGCAPCSTYCLLASRLIPTHLSPASHSSQLPDDSCWGICPMVKGGKKGKKKWNHVFHTLSSFSSPLCFLSSLPWPHLCFWGHFPAVTGCSFPSVVQLPTTQRQPVHHHHKYWRAALSFGFSHCPSPFVWSRLWAAETSPPLGAASCLANVCLSLSGFFQYHHSHFRVLNSFAWNTHSSFFLSDQNSSQPQGSSSEPPSLTPGVTHQHTHLFWVSSLPFSLSANFSLFICLCGAVSRA